MYDTVYFRLTQNEVSNVDFLAEIPVYLDNVGEHSYNGQNVVTGDLNGLKITLNRWQMKIKDGSLCKWYLGNNFQTMGKRDAKDAISALSDTLHLPIDKALITRLDVAQNLIMRYPADVYFSHLGVLRYATRLQEPGGIYYNRAGGRLCFYDKNKEQKSHKEPIPDLYIGRNVLRYEQRYIGRLAAQFKAKEVTGAMLYFVGYFYNLTHSISYRLRIYISHPQQTCTKIAIKKSNEGGARAYWQVGFEIIDVFLFRLPSHLSLGWSCFLSNVCPRISSCFGLIIWHKAVRFDIFSNRR